MWVFMSDGMVSIVKDRDYRARLLVRARRFDDVFHFLDGLQDPDHLIIQQTDDADYRFRSSVPRSIAIRAVKRVLSKMEYQNFKGSVQDSERGAIYMRVWSAALALDERDAERRAWREDNYDEQPLERVWYPEGPGTDPGEY